MVVLTLRKMIKDFGGDPKAIGTALLFYLDPSNSFPVLNNNHFKQLFGTLFDSEIEAIKFLELSVGIN